jgi:hypothetical protein
MTAPHRRWFLLALAGLPLLLISAAVALGPRLPNPALAAVEPPSPPTADPAPAKPGRPVAADGRHHPLVPSDPQVVADLLVSLEEALRSADTAADSLPALGHQPGDHARTGGA